MYHLYTLISSHLESGALQAFPTLVTEHCWRKTVQSIQMYRSFWPTPHTGHWQGAGGATGRWDRHIAVETAVRWERELKPSRPIMIFPTVSPSLLLKSNHYSDFQTTLLVLSGFEIYMNVFLTFFTYFKCIYAHISFLGYNT